MIKSAYIAAMAIILGCSAVNAQSPGFHVLKTFHIASGGGWDYIALNPVTENLYVSHGKQVNIINKNTGDSVGVINNTDGVHGIAFAPEFRKGFTSNGRLNTVTVFDISANAVLAQIKTGENPDAIMYDAFSKRVYVCNGHSNDITIIDPATDKVIETVALGGKPETAVPDGAGKVYINIEDKNEVVVLNTRSRKVEDRWKTGKGDEPAGLAMDVKTKRLFVGCGNKLLVVMNAENGEVVKEITIGDGCDGTAFDSRLRLVFCSTGEGVLSIIKEKSGKEFELLENAATKKGARTLVLDESTHTVFLPTAEFEAAPAGSTEHKRRPMVPGSFQVLAVGK